MIYIKTKLDNRSKYLRKIIVDCLSIERRGHIGSSMSIVEILRVLYDDILKFNSKKINLHDRDRFILSKGHGCLALYSILFDKGFLNKKQLMDIGSIKSILGRSKSTPGYCSSAKDKPRSIINHLPSHPYK